MDGEVPEKELNANGRWAWPRKFKLLAITPHQCMPDDVALYPLAPWPVRPWTYKNQPSDNLEASRLGTACRKAAEDPKCGDSIDRGLILLRELQAAGYGIVKL